MATYPIRSKTTRLLVKALSILAACFLALLSGGATMVRGQDFQAGGYFTTVVPHGEFNDYVTNNGYGGGGYFLVRLGSSPFLAGGDVGIVTYGSKTRDEPFSNTIPNVFVRVRTSNNILLAHSLVRVQPREWRIRPYLDGLIGLKHLFTRTTISDDLEEIASTTDLSDTAFSYGFGGGVQVPISQSGGVEILLDGNVRYLRGGRADYLRKGSIRQENGLVFYDIYSSRTDVVAVQVGVSFRF
jgi:hypothetical protein